MTEGEWREPLAVPDIVRTDAMEKSTVVIPLHLSPLRYGFGASIFGALAAAMAYLSVQPTLAKPSMTPRGQEIGRMLMSVDRIGGVWPLAAAAALAMAAAALFVVWVVVARRPFDLTLDAEGVTWPSLAPWRQLRTLAWSEVASVAPNQARDHLVFMTRRGRHVLPVWWLPPETSAADVIATATSLRTNAQR